ncbi:hypothetical protein IFM46972_10585 [Aspergillus udagawae]|uniref:Uncharacterized protein n=1 Tax=Aspergillus udagawae TaxID=91492 RepID=A0A8H3SDP9_9EURO|nr:uncharacterized protein Aud_006857 [Aspergillus udagawae]GFF56708.1 hypothetical protein IFM46972_10585 [Aspergillus udagawae]GIC90423.1 hypothetical protein Aud_006857 [Aspergillus udagawae]
MGQMVSSVIDSIQNDAEKQRLANDALNQMEELGNQQVESFMLAVTNRAVDAKLIPVGQIMHQESIVRCGISNTPDDIGKEITDAFGSFVKGDLAKGISTVVQDGIKALVGSYEGNKSTRTSYTITTGDLGGIQRVDIRMFAWRYSSKQLIDITKDMIAVAVIISSVDPKLVTDFSIRTLIQEQYGNLPLDQQQALLKTILDAKKEASSV